jgi:CRISPR-associated protein Csb1
VQTPAIENLNQIFERKVVVSLQFSELLNAVSGPPAAFRSVTQLQPVGGSGDKVLPATFAGGAYARERRRIDDREVDCVLIDSVQSQSNRAEEALKRAIEKQQFTLPLIEVDFSAANNDFRSPLPNLTSLDVPHRLADAILRDSELQDGTRFSKSEYAKKWGRSNVWNATAIYELCPTALVFGMWGSPDKPGGLGAKFERAYVSEIVAVDVVSNRSDEPTDKDGRKDLINKRGGFRIDPLGSSRNVALKQREDGTFEVGTGKLRPSELNHGNILFESTNAGVRFRYTEQTTVVSLGALRKLRFPINGAPIASVDDAGRAVLAAIALCAGVLSAESGTSLRSRCHLWPVADREWELLERPGHDARRFKLRGEQAIALVNEAVTYAKSAGLGWMEEKLILRPSKELVDLVRQSQENAAKEKGEGEAQ